MHPDYVLANALAVDAWIVAIPENPYELCPCGCGKKWRFVVKESEEALAEHEKRFVEKWAAEFLKCKVGL